MLRILIFCLIFTISLATQAHNEANVPRLGDSLNKTITLSEEKKIGRNIYRNLQGNNYILNDPLVHDYIVYLGNRLSRNLSLERDYVFFVTKSKSVNAFAVLGGFIGINAGLLNLTVNEAQLAGVLSHELGHIVLRHSAEMMARSNVNSIPMWIGIFAGLLSGQTESSITAIKSGIGLSVQNNINLIRENEIEADNFAINLMIKSNFDLSEQADFFKLMQGDSNNQFGANEYFMTHPLYNNRIAYIRDRAKVQNEAIKNSSDDYFYIRNLINTDFNNKIDSNDYDNDSAIYIHKKALQLFSAGENERAKELLLKKYLDNKSNIYIASLLSKVLLDMREIEKSRNILQETLRIYPNNNAIKFQLYKNNIQQSHDINRSINNLNEITDNNIYNPVFFKVLAEGYSKLDKKYKSITALINYYTLKGDIKMAFKVIDEGLDSSRLNYNQKENLRILKNNILCDSNPPLEPIFGDKTCN